MPIAVSKTVPYLALASALALSACMVQPVRPPRPRPVVEVVPAAPAPGFRWVKGHYRWERDRWVWIRGHRAPL